MPLGDQVSVGIAIDCSISFGPGHLLFFHPELWPLFWRTDRNRPLFLSASAGKYGMQKPNGSRLYQRSDRDPSIYWYTAIFAFFFTFTMGLFTSHKSHFSHRFISDGPFSHPRGIRPAAQLLFLDVFSNRHHTHHSNHYPIFATGCFKQSWLVDFISGSVLYLWKPIAGLWEKGPF